MLQAFFCSHFGAMYAFCLCRERSQSLTKLRSQEQGTVKNGWLCLQRQPLYSKGQPQKHRFFVQQQLWADRLGHLEGLSRLSIDGL